MQQKTKQTFTNAFAKNSNFSTGVRVPYPREWIAVSEKCPNNEKYDPENYSEYFYDAV